MNTLEKAEPIASVCHIEIFSKSGIPIYNFKVPDTVGKTNEKENKHKKSVTT